MAEVLRLPPKPARETDDVAPFGKRISRFGAFVLRRVQAREHFRASTSEIHSVGAHLGAVDGDGVTAGGAREIEDAGRVDAGVERFVPAARAREEVGDFQEGSPVGVGGGWRSDRTPAGAPSQL